MAPLQLLFVLTFLLLGRAGAISVPSDRPNQLLYQPVIAIFAQPSEDLEPVYHADEGYSYFPSSYVKWVESAGGRVVPLPYNLNMSETIKILDRVNGILMPGGDASLWVNETTQTGFSNFTKRGQVIYDKIIEYNDFGSYFPIWATCMSYEMILMIVTQNDKILDHYNSTNHLLNTTIDNYDKSKLYQSIPAHYQDIIQKKQAFFYSHHYGIDVDHFQRTPELNRTYYLTSHSSFQNKTFVSTLEAMQYPFTLSQYHPEKNANEWLETINANHDPEAIQASQLEANYFVNQATKSDHRFDSYEQYQQYSIYNYQPIPWNDSWCEIYVFKVPPSSSSSRQ